jgi:hypothetical protein
MRRMNKTRWWRRHQPERIAPTWLGPLPAGPVVFEPSLRTAAEYEPNRTRARPADVEPRQAA